jgi:hypothetical protein
MLAAFPQTTFMGHADAFWANVSADYRSEASYSSGPIVRGGVTDKWLGDHANLFGAWPARRWACSSAPCRRTSSASWCGATPTGC